MCFRFCGDNTQLLPYRRGPPCCLFVHRESIHVFSRTWQLVSYTDICKSYGCMCQMYRGADKSLARPTSRCILFDGENISFDASLVMYTNSTNISPIMIINRIYETQNLLSVYLVSFLVRLRTYQHPCKVVWICTCTICAQKCIINTGIKFPEQSAKLQT